MVIRSKTIRFGIFLSTIVISIILLIQVIWLYKLYRFEEKEFDHHVFGVLKETYAKIKLVDDPTLNLNDLVVKASPRLYLAKVKNWQSPDSIINTLEDGFEDFDIFADCRISLFDHGLNKFIYETEIHPSANNHKPLPPLPANLDKPNFNSIVFYFPNRESYILFNMLFWIISSIILLGVLIWLGASIFYLYRQKTFNELQRDFVNNFTHEFKTPLSVIMLAAESLKKRSLVQKPEKITQYADMVQYQSRYLQGQIDRLLRHSFSENSELKLIREKFDVNTLIEEAIKNLQPLVEEKNAAVIFEQEASSSYIWGDRNYLFIVLINLIENALKYASDPKVIVTTINERDKLKVSVRDNGVGIEEKYFKQIFKKFFRVPKGDIHSSKGFGIGLSFVKRIIDSHHGEIEVKSVPGVGSCFTITLHQNGIYHASEKDNSIAG